MNTLRFQVFVYGTLKKGEVNHILFEGDFKDCKPCTLNNFQLYDTGMGFPAILPKVGQKVEGELYTVDYETLIRLDLLEGAGRENGLYKRQIATVYFHNEKVDCFVYVWNKAQTYLQPCGESWHGWQGGEIK